jgi:hypothetical protein
MAALYDSIGGRPEGAARSRAVCHAQARSAWSGGRVPMTPDGKLGTTFFHLSSRQVDRCRPGRRAKPLSNWAQENRNCTSSAAYRPGSGARAAGIENRGRLDRGESNHRARLAFKGLSPAGCPFPACVALAEAAGAFRRGGASGGTGRPRALAHGRPRGWGNWQRSGTAICRRASARARLLARNMLPTALRVWSDKLANAGG